MFMVLLSLQEIKPFPTLGHRRNVRPPQVPADYGFFLKKITGAENFGMTQAEYFLAWVHVHSAENFGVTQAKSTHVSMRFGGESSSAESSDGQVLYQS